MDAVEIPIRDEVIRLGQLLKLAGVVDDGVQARELLADEAVEVDGVGETRRGRQVGVGSEVAIALPRGVTRLRVVREDT